MEQRIAFSRPWNVEVSYFLTVCVCMWCAGFPCFSPPCVVCAHGVDGWVTLDEPVDVNQARALSIVLVHNASMNTLALDACDLRDAALEILVITLLLALFFPRPAVRMPCTTL